MQKNAPEIAMAAPTYQNKIKVWQISTYLPYFFRIFKKKQTIKHKK